MILLHQIPDELRDRVLLAVVSEYDDATAPMEHGVRWSECDLDNEALLVDLRATVDDVVALGELIRQLSWARRRQGAWEVLVDAELLERVVHRALCDELLMFGGSVTGPVRLLTTSDFRSRTRTIERLTSEIENIREAAGLPTPRPDPKKSDR